MTVHLNLDTRDLANTYDRSNDWVLTSGCILIEKLAVKSGDVVLDIGCGTGRLGQHVSSIIGSAGRFVGIDPLEERVNIAKKNNEHPQAIFQRGLAEDLSFVVSDSIDIVYLNWVLHWVLSRETALNEIRRVLKTGGKVGVALPPKELNSAGVNWVIDGVLAREPYNNLVRVEDAPQKRHGITTTELIYLLTAAGLKVLDVQVRMGLREFQSAQDIINFYESSLFGNFLNHVPISLRAQATADIKAEFEQYRTEDGLKFEYYTIFAIAEKIKDS